jgi:hypothetical protein
MNKTWSDSKYIEIDNIIKKHAAIFAGVSTNTIWADIQPLSELQHMNCRTLLIAYVIKNSDQSPYKTDGLECLGDENFINKYLELFVHLDVKHDDVYVHSRSRYLADVVRYIRHLETAERL